jgi:hypothetical protein
MNMGFGLPVIVTVGTKFTVLVNAALKSLFLKALGLTPRVHYKHKCIRTLALYSRIRFR